MFLNKRLVEDNSHKTVIVVDHSPKFAKSSGTEVVSTFNDSGFNASSVLGKTLWNCSVEATLEFHRVLVDLFPRGSKQLRIVVCDFAARFLTRPWEDSLIQYEELLQAFSTCDVPQASADASSCSIINGISMAIEVLSERSKLQEKASDVVRNNLKLLEKDISKHSLISANSENRLAELRKIFLVTPKKKDSIEEEEEEGLLISSGEFEDAFENENIGAVSTSINGAVNQESAAILRNSGTIVVFTSLEQKSDYEDINNAVMQQIKHRNDSIRLVGDENLLPIEHVNLIVVNLLDATKRKELDRFHFSEEYNASYLKSTLLSTVGGEPLLSTVRKVLQNVYDLVSTTISGIPMKEEAQQGQSTNYDVELLHRRSAHTELAGLGVLRPGSKIVAKIADGSYDTICLRWCTSGPKLKSDKFPLLRNSHLLTPANVNSRPTVCLTSFVLAGKCVMLEVQRDAIASTLVEKAETDGDGKGCVIDAASESKFLLQPNLHQRLISHYLCRDEASGALVIQCVAMGKKATLNGFLVPEVDLESDENKDEFNTEEFNLPFMRHFMSAATLVMKPPTLESIPLIPPSTVAEAQKTAITPALTWAQRMESTRRLRQNVLNLSQYFPWLRYDSLIFNFSNYTEMFDLFLSNLRKPLINAGDFESMCQWIGKLTTSRIGTENIIQTCVYNAKRTLTKEEFFRITVEEIARLICNSAHVSVTHFALLNTLLKTCGVPFTVPIPPIAPDFVAERERRAKAIETEKIKAGRKRPADSLQDKETMNLAKRFKKRFSTPWRSNESINLLEHFTTLQEQNRWTKWREFVGRENTDGEVQAKLYPNLKLPEPTPPADLTAELTDKAAAMVATANSVVSNEKPSKPVQQQHGNKPPHKSKNLGQQQHQRLNQPLLGSKPLGRGHHQNNSPHMGGGRGSRKGHHDSLLHHGGRGRGSHFSGRPMGRRGGPPSGSSTPLS